MNLLGTYAKLIGVAALWGGTFIAGRIAAPLLPHFTLSALRFWTAFGLLLPVLFIIEKKLPRLCVRDGLFTLMLALVGLVIYNLLFLGALELIPASRTALVVALNPILTSLGMALVFRERLAPHRWLGILLALTGVCVVLAKGNPLQIILGLGQGEVLMLGGAMCWAIYTILGRFALQNGSSLSPLSITTFTTLWGALMLSIGIPFEWDQWQIAQWEAAGLRLQVIGAILYLGAGGTALAFVWYAQGLKRLGAARTAVFNNLVPVFGVLLGALLLSEPLLPSMILGGLVALLGVSLTNWNEKK